jgi:hypothetical protein
MQQLCCRPNIDSYGLNEYFSTTATIVNEATMKRQIVVMFVALWLCALASPGVADKKRDWQEGKLIDVSNEPYTYGSVVNGTGGIHQGEHITYRIDDGKYIYTAKHSHRRHDKALPVTVNDKVKFAIEKEKVFILDEDHKEHELKFVKKTLKDAAN